MGKRYEEMFDNGRMTLVPIPGTTKIRVVIFAALDPDPSDADKELHGKELSFKNNFRPANRYLYYHYAVTLLRRQRYAVPGWWRAFALMLTLARNIGHLPPEEAKFFVSPQGLPESDEDAPEFDGPDDSQKDLLIAATINMRPGPSDLKNPFIRERRGLWKLDSRYISKEFEDMVVDNEDEDGSKDEGEDGDEDEDEDEGEDSEE
ncbi:hypothetical protein EDB80DRAFT_685712 [Ilyonectria destructans]|nr:hypothetical protein EDB80DRAFT_685712 [Ilyonectria destructans]